MTRRVAIGVAVLAALCVYPAAPVVADDTYVAHTCRTPDGKAASTDGWAPGSTSGHAQHVVRSVDCTKAGLSAGPSQIEFPKWGNFS